MLTLRGALTVRSASPSHYSLLALSCCTLPKGHFLEVLEAQGRESTSCHEGERSTYIKMWANLCAALVKSKTPEGVLRCIIEGIFSGGQRCIEVNCLEFGGSCPVVRNERMCELRAYKRGTKLPAIFRGRPRQKVAKPVRDC